MFNNSANLLFRALRDSTMACTKLQSRCTVTAATRGRVARSKPRVRGYYDQFSALNSVQRVCVLWNRARTAEADTLRRMYHTEKLYSHSL